MLAVSAVARGRKIVIVDEHIRHEALWHCRDGVCMSVLHVITLAQVALDVQNGNGYENVINIDAFIIVNSCYTTNG